MADADKQLKDTVKLVAQGLEERGMLREAARELAERHRKVVHRLQRDCACRPCHAVSTRPTPPTRSDRW